MKKYLSNFIVLFIPWILLSGFNLTDLVLGAIVSMVLVWIIKDYLKISFSSNFLISTFIFLFQYIPVFIIELVKANIDITKRVLDPNLPIDPGFVRIPTNIKNDYGKLILANSITLTPGTLSIDTNDNNVFIHWISLKGNSTKTYQENVSDNFENILRRIYK